MTRLHSRRRGLALLLLLGGALTAQGALADQLDHSISRDETRQQLLGVRQRVSEIAREGKKPLVVCDIDDTVVHKACRPAEGAVPFLKSVIDLGARVVYVTGRGTKDADKTYDMLKRLGLPVDGQKVLFNPGGMDAADWKRSARDEILKRGVPVAFFENDKRSACIYSAQYPECRVFRMNTRSSRDPVNPPGPNLSVIDAFYCDQAGCKAMTPRGESIRALLRSSTRAQ